MPKKLPKGWVKTSLGEVCLPVSSIQPGDFAEFTYFDIGGIDNERNRIAETKIVTGRNAPSRARQALRKDDILFSTVRTYLRKIARVERDYLNPVASTGFAVIRAAEGVSSQFLFFQVLSEDFLQPLNALQSGSSYPAVRARDVFAQPILLPPSREQERIAAKLSAASSALQRAESASGRAQERLKRYRAAVLYAAGTGELTRTWRESHPKMSKDKTETGKALLQRLIAARRARWEETEFKRLRENNEAPEDDAWKSRYREPILPDPNDSAELPNSWTWASIDQLSWDSGYGTSVKCTHEAKGPAVLRIPNIRNRVLDFRDLKFAGSSGDLRNHQFVAPGDFLLIRTNGSKDLIGRAALVRNEPKKKFGFASYLIRFRLVGKAGIWSWVVLAWDSPLVRAHIEAKAATSAGQYNVSLSRLSGTAIPLPPLAEQSEIVREVERRLLAADRLELTLDKQLARARVTHQLLLREAFSGRLISQDPKDEPASVLLEHIRAAREAEAQKRKGNDMKRSISKSKIDRRPLVEVLREYKKPMTPEQLFREAGFDPSQVDQFYRELTSLRDQLLEQKPKAAEAQAWPQHAHVFLQLKKGR